MFKPATTIDEVISTLENIISDSIRSKSRAGYFATLYLKVTSSVKEGIQSNRFQNGNRMEELDVTFANRYLEAYYQWQNKEDPTASWQFSFQETAKSSALILEQLLLGMSAHINLDLGIATAQTQADNKAPLEDIHVDFDTMNSIISSLTYEALAELDKVSPLLSLLGLHAGNTNSVLIQFSIVNARDGAWCFAGELYGKSGTDFSSNIHERDQNILQLGKSIINQKGMLSFTIWLIHLFEWKNPAKIIRALSNTKKKHFTVGKTLPVQ
jgi:hypothetical protein